MSLSFLYSEADPSWANAVSKGMRTSRHWLLALCFNVLNAVNLAQLYSTYHGDSRVGPYLLIFIMVIVWMLAVGAYYMYRLYRVTREQILRDSLEDGVKQTLLKASFLGFRLYMFLLGISFVILASVNWAHFQ